VNDTYWGPKLERTRDRDVLDAQALARAGWSVVRLWEHVPLTDAVAAVEAALITAEGDSSVGTS
jgi:DNA mismatch endonuclease (patch repair protein)